MILNVMKVRQIFNDKVDSINFKNAIVQSQLPFELSEFEKDIEEMIIEEEYGNDYFGNLIIENYPNLQSIVVKKNSFKNLNSLKICNCEKLKNVETGYQSFYNTTSLSLSSNSIIFYFSLYLPNLQSFITGNWSFSKISSLSLSSRIFLFLFIQMFFLQMENSIQKEHL